MFRIALVQDLPMPDDTRAAFETAAGDAAPSFAHIDELVATSDAPIVWLHTRTGLHAEYAIKALQAGRDVVCNAPLCITSSAAWQILETSKYTGRRLMVINHCSRFWRQAVRELGTLRRVHAWARASEDPGGSVFPDGGQLYGIFYPLAEALHTVLGPVESLKGSLEHGAAESLEQSGHVEMSLGSGGTAYLDWSVAATTDAVQPGFSVTLEGENGSLTVSGTFGQGKLLLNSVEPKGIEMADPGSSKCLADRLPSVLDGASDGRLDAFRALQVVEFIDRIYTRLRGADA
ncbi:MAG: Gfo/Idh/MocA family oxidoreductase [Sphingobacteriales bacterium]|nr:MAG: Gfo/Idh/MocA family oxidoreductase [Sphingobacteriales bacterium]